MTEEERLANQKLREFRKRICDRENIRLMKLLSNTDIKNISTKPWPSSEEDLISRIANLEEIRRFWEEFLQELSESYGHQISGASNVIQNFVEDIDIDQALVSDEKINLELEGSPEFLEEDQEDVDYSGEIDFINDETIPDEYEFEPIKKIYSGNIDIDTKNARYFNIFSSIFFIKIWWKLWKEKAFFNEFSKDYPLTKQQKVAVLSNENRNLVVAGAGTGKTHLMIAKAGYLLKKKGIKEQDILLLAFNNDAAAQLRNRGKERLDANLHAYTFHSYGNELSKSLSPNRNLNPDEEDQKIKKPKWIQTALDTLPLDHPIMKKVLRYFSEYLVPPPSPNMDYKSLNEYQSYVKNIEKRSLSGDKVKSYGELLIANFLTINGIDFEYEAKFNSENIRYSYRPDFTIYKNRERSEEIVVEFFGIDRDGNVKPGILPERYKNLTTKKIELHKNEKTDFIDLYYYEQQEGLLLKKLETELKNRGVTFKKLDDEELLSRFNDSQYFTIFSQLCSEFLEQYKSNQHNIKDLLIKAGEDERSIAFLHIFEWIKNQYNAYLDSNDLKDFSDMINDGTKALLEAKYQTEWKWIIVDEFQDISAGRLRFINAILEQNPDAKLMVVGDDWQSIYRFAGSDINLVTKFEKYFGRSVEFKLTKSFRFNSQIKDLSQKFIQANPMQKRKNITVDRTVEPYKNWVHWSDQGLIPEKRSKKIVEIVKKMKEELKLQGELLILARYNHNLPKGPQLKEIGEIWGENFRYMTVHRAKGQEADYVLLVDLISGVFGFPAIQSEDPILNLVLASAGPEDLLMYGEERRLLYVAMTRAREEFHAISDVPQPSIFVNEVLEYE